MNKTSEHTVDIDLTQYKKQILAEEDKLLFDEVKKCTKVGALRAAYIMIWIACAESLKRRFKEASKRDSNARKIVRKITELERNYKPIDTYVLEEAHKYGFVSSSTYEKLKNIYTFRCVYAHPYEEAPTVEELLSSVSIIVGNLLSQPVKLKEGFINKQVEEIFNNQSYLDDVKERVYEYTKELLPRISEDCHMYFLYQLSSETEKIIEDPTLTIFNNRGLWVLSTFLEANFEELDVEDWHDYVNSYPKTTKFILSKKVLFEKIGVTAQDSVVANILEASSKTPTDLQSLEELWESNSLSERQAVRFFGFLENFNESSNREVAESLAASGLKIKTCYDALIVCLKIHNWHVQNPVAIMIKDHGINEISELQDDKQVCLGRNVLQAATGWSHGAIGLLKAIIDDKELWPDKFVFGLFIECFVNENNRFRFKIIKLDKVCKIIDKYGEAERNNILDETMKIIDISTYNQIFTSITNDNLDECASVFKDHTWGDSFYKQIKEALDSKKVESE